MDHAVCQSLIFDMLVSNSAVNCYFISVKYTVIHSLHATKNLASSHAPQPAYRVLHTTLLETPFLSRGCHSISVPNCIVDWQSTSKAYLSSLINTKYPRSQAVHKELSDLENPLPISNNQDCPRELNVNSQGISDLFQSIPHRSQSSD